MYREGRQIHDRPLAGAQLGVRPDPAMPGRVVDDVRRGHVVIERRRERRAVLVVVHDHRDGGGEKLRVQAAEDSRAPLATVRLGHLERRMIGVRDERERALRMAATHAG
jgi:hypothetical protein